MRLTIVPIDKMVGSNGLFFVDLDLSACDIPQNIHALQWYETEGEVEFIDNSDRTKPQNKIIAELPIWASACLKKWNEAKIASEVPKKASADQPITTGIQTA